MSDLSSFLKMSVPKRNKNAYMFFVADKREEVKNSNPDLKHKEIVAKLGELWREMSEEEKKPYEKQAAADKERYAKEKAEAGEPAPTKKTKKGKETKKAKSSKKSKEAEKEGSEEEVSESDEESE